MFTDGALLIQIKTEWEWQFAIRTVCMFSLGIALDLMNYWRKIYKCIEKIYLVPYKLYILPVYLPLPISQLQVVVSSIIRQVISSPQAMA